MCKFICKVTERRREGEYICNFDSYCHINLDQGCTLCTPTVLFMSGHFPSAKYPQLSSL